MITHSATLYLAAVLIWGSSWFAIKFQLGTVAPEVSLAYRFGLASAILLVYCLWRGLNLRFSPREHIFIALQGLLLFCLNYLIFYWATELVTSGLNAVIFSTIVFMNIFNGALIFRNPIRSSMIVGAVLGLAGISLVFWPEIASLQASGDTLRGAVMALGATFLASLGNMASVRNQSRQLPVIQTNAFGMGYGALIMLIWALGTDAPLNYDTSLDYTLSLLYLSIFASVLAFGSYLTLLGRIGADRAAYATVLFPVVALMLSTFFEGYRWSATSLTGVSLVLLGNLIVVTNAQLRARFVGALRKAFHSAS